MKVISVIFSIIGIISLIGLTLIFIPVSNERAEESQTKLNSAIKDVDKIVNRAIEHCVGETTFECNQLMTDWFEECKKEDLIKIPSCHDGRISSYLETNNLIKINNEMTKSTNLNTLNENYLLMFDSCLDALDRLNDGFAQYGPESEEFSSLLDDFQPVREGCNKSVDDIKNLCKREKNTPNYFEACDDPRLDVFPI